MSAQMEQKAKAVAELLKVLANEYRLLILCYLLEQPETVGVIQDKIGKISQSAVSQHLSLLKAHGIIDYEKQGQNIRYFIKDERVEEIVNVLRKHYC